MTDATKKILVILSDNICSVNAITQFLSDYAGDIGSVKDAGVIDIFGEVKLPIKKRLSTMQPDRSEKSTTQPPNKQMNALLQLAQKMDSDPKIRDAMLAALAQQRKEAPEQTVDGKLEADRKAKKADAKKKAQA